MKILYKDAELWCQKHGGIPYLETSAKDATNVTQAFYTAAEIALSQRPIPTPQTIQEELPKVDLNKTPPNDDSGCC